jgi:hypothetical protein
MALLLYGFLSQIKNFLLMKRETSDFCGPYLALKANLVKIT